MSSNANLPLREEAEQDVDAMLCSLELQLIRRYMDQRHWHQESEAARAADRAEPGLKLENVAAHSWHVADAIMLLAPNFPEVDQRHAVELAIVHDKLELLTGDFNPVGPDGQGTSSHAFDADAQVEKTEIELRALDEYLARLRKPMRDRQRELILETIRGETAEARLVKAVDKLQALSFVLAKKAGDMTDEHLSFSLRYSFKAVEYFPKMAMHHIALVIRLLKLVANHRRIALADLLSNLPATEPPSHRATEPPSRWQPASKHVLPDEVCFSRKEWVRQVDRWRVSWPTRWGQARPDRRDLPPNCLHAVWERR